MQKATTMDKFDIIGEMFRTARDNGWAFCAGDDFHQNIAATEETMEDGQLVLAVDFNCTPTFLNSRVPAISYSGSIALGRKFDDDGTPADLDETFWDKYQRRLLDLQQQLALFIGTFECTHALNVVSAEFVMTINRFDTNIDFVVCNITFEQL